MATWLNCHPLDTLKPLPQNAVLEKLGEATCTLQRAQSAQPVHPTSIQTLPVMLRQSFTSQSPKVIWPQCRITQLQTHHVRRQRFAVCGVMLVS